MKKLLTILVLIMLIISFFQITNMYALYKEQIQGQYSSLLGAWEIKVNGQDITTSGQIETFTITDSQFGYVESEYIQAGKIAPGGQVYFDIVIDPSNTDVSITYTINLSKDTEKNVEYEITKVEEYFKKDGQEQQIANEQKYQLKNENLYTSVIPVNKIVQGYKNYIRIYFKWKNIEDNNETDTVIGEAEENTISIPIQINLKQYTGEEISNDEQENT